MAPVDALQVPEPEQPCSPLIVKNTFLHVGNDPQEELGFDIDPWDRRQASEPAPRRQISSKGPSMHKLNEEVAEEDADLPTQLGSSDTDENDNLMIDSDGLFRQVSPVKLEQSSDGLYRQVSPWDEMSRQVSTQSAKEIRPSFGSFCRQETEQQWPTYESQAVANPSVAPPSSGLNPNAATYHPVQQDVRPTEASKTKPNVGELQLMQMIPEPSQYLNNHSPSNTPWPSMTLTDKPAERKTPQILHQRNRRKTKSLISLAQMHQKKEQEQQKRQAKQALAWAEKMKAVQQLGQAVPQQDPQDQWDTEQRLPHQSSNEQQQQQQSRTELGHRTRPEWSDMKDQPSQPEASPSKSRMDQRKAPAPKAQAVSPAPANAQEDDSCVRFCPNCGGGVKQGFKFCRFCGHQVSQLWQM